MADGGFPEGDFVVKQISRKTGEFNLFCGICGDYIRDLEDGRGDCTDCGSTFSVEQMRSPFIDLVD